MLSSTPEAEDATQETFVRALKNFHSLRAEIAISSWLRSIAHHVCIDFIRKRARGPIHVAEIEAESTIPINQNSEIKEECETIHFLVRKLPENLREIVFLHYYEEMTYDEMAQWLGIARSTVNDRLSKARQLLKSQLQQEGYP